MASAHLSRRIDAARLALTSLGLGRTQVFGVAREIRWVLPRLLTGRPELGVGPLGPAVRRRTTRTTFAQVSMQSF